MRNPFVTKDTILEKEKKFSMHDTKHHGDGFFIDKKYQGKVGLSVSLRKVDWLFFIISIISILLLFRTFYLQIIKHENYRLLAEGNRIKTEVLPSPRGIIYDSQGLALTTNVAKYSLFIEKNILDNENVDQQELMQDISSITHMTQEEIEAQLPVAADREQAIKKSIGYPQEILIASNIDYQQAMSFKANQNDYFGLKLQLTPERHYLEDKSLSHILGYLGKITSQEWEELKYKNYQFYDLIGKAGIEKEYEQVLKGEYGYVQKEVDAHGQEIKTINRQEPIAGKDVMLTVDQKFNQQVYQILNNTLQKINKNKATVIVINPQNGEILSLVSAPSFNSNYFVNSEKYTLEIADILNNSDQPLFNRAIAGEYPSGSTFKPVMALAALEENLITRWTQVLSVGGIKIGEWFYPDWKAGGHGLTNVVKALAESVNTFFYYIGGGYQDFKGLGLEKIISYAKEFYFSRPLGIDLPGEVAGFLPSREWKQEKKDEAWYIGDTYHLSIGQGDILVTPLQITSMIATIANGGKIYQPHLVKKIIDPVSGEEFNVTPKILQQNFIQPENIQIVQQGLRQAVTSGSATYLNDLPVAVAGKTGTAQVGGDQESHAWFTGYAPYNNPEIVVTVLVENAGGGDVISVPIAKQIFQWYFANK